MPPRLLVLILNFWSENFAMRPRVNIRLADADRKVTRKWSAAKFLVAALVAGAVLCLPAFQRSANAPTSVLADSLGGNLGLNLRAP
jgi:hypothetical protein